MSSPGVYRAHGGLNVNIPPFGTVGADVDVYENMQETGANGPPSLYAVPEVELFGLKIPLLAAIKVANGQSDDWNIPAAIPTPIGPVTGTIHVEIDDYQFTATTPGSQRDGVVKFLVVIKLVLHVPMWPSPIKITVPHGIPMTVPLPANRDTQVKVTVDPADLAKAMAEFESVLTVATK